MSGYTAEEVQATVENLVQSTITFPTDVLGVRRTDVTFTQVQSAAASAFCLYPNAPLYLLWLGAQQVPNLIAAELDILAQLTDAANAVSRNVLPVDDVTSLFDARAALRELASAAAGRTSAFQDVTKAPAYQRFSDATDRFLAGPGQSVKANGEITMTADQARTALPPLLASLKEAHASLVSALTALAAGLEDYNQVSLPALLASAVATNGAALLGEDADALDALSPAERTAKLRDVVLHVIAAKAMVTTFGSFSGPSDYRALVGTLLPILNAAHPGIAPRAVATTDRPGRIVAGVNDAFSYQLDGGPLVTFLLPPSALAQLEGLGSDPFLFSPANDQLRLRIADDALTLTLPDGTRSAAEVAIALNAQLPTTVRAEAFFFPTRYLGNVQTAGSTVTARPGTASFLALQLAAGDQLTLAGVSYPILAVTDITLTVDGVLPTSASVYIEAGPTGQRLRLRANDPVAQLLAETSLQVFSDTPASKACLQVLGFIDGVKSTCAPTLATQMAAYVNQLAPELTASTQLNVLAGQVKLRTNPFDPLTLTLSTAVFTATASFNGSVLTLTVTAVEEPGPAAPGNVLVVRAGGAALPVDAAFVLQTVSGDIAVGTTLTATPETLGLNAFSNTASLSLELGPDIPLLPYDVITLATGPNNGRYTSEGWGDSPLDIRVREPVPLVQKAGRSLRDLGDVDAEVLVVEVEKKTFETKMSTGCLFSNNFYLSLHERLSALSTSISLGPPFPKTVEVGDVLEVYTTDYKTPAVSTRVVAVNRTESLIEVADPFAVGVSYPLAPQPPPFARVRVGTVSTFTAFKTATEGWLGPAGAQDQSGLDRLLNPLLVNKNPTAVSVGDFKNALGGVENQLAQLPPILAGFTIAPVSAVDALLATFTQKGSDRAVALLTGGQFQEFFGMDQDGASYAGAMQAAARGVARNDLPVRKTDRTDVRGGRLLSQAESPDAEYDFTGNDVNESFQPDSLEE